MFIVRILIIISAQHQPFYTQTERRGKGQVAGEKERGCVRETESNWKMELASVIKRPLEEGLTILGFPRILAWGFVFSWETILMVEERLRKIH
jgi:hypothetical protein